MSSASTSTPSFTPAEIDRELSINHSALPWQYNTTDHPAVGTLLHPTTVPLFTPISLLRSAAASSSAASAYTLKNRIVVSPMCQYSSDDGYLNDWHLVHLGQYASGGAALVIQEATAVHPHGRISPYDAGLYYDGHMVQMKRIVDYIHSQHALAGIQLAHAGRKASTPPLFFTSTPLDPQLTWPEHVAGPSSVPYAPKDWITPRELSLSEIEQFKRDFITAVQRAKRIGYDLIEIHAAHGYLLNNFLSPLSNQRTDQYGGSFANRIRLLVELTKEVRQVWGKDRPLAVRLTCDEWVGSSGWQMADTIELCRVLIDECQVDLIDASSGGNTSLQQIAAKPSYQVPFAAEIKRVFGDKVIVGAVGLITDAKQANEIVGKGEADVILLAREMLRDPHFAYRAAQELGVDFAYPPQYARAKPHHPRL